VTGTEWVQGEVSSLRRAASGHQYFALKDEQEDAVIDCVMYRFQARQAAAHLVEGARLQVFGRATIWAPRGRLQLVVERARPCGRGALLEALEKLKGKLAAEGLFDGDRKRALPSDPRVLGVVTSSAGAAFHDICTVAFRRGGLCIVLAPARVQGEGAPESMLRAIDLIERYPGLDVLVVGRGGGSGDDLMAFNDERLVRRLARVSVPVISAVGHQIDTTLTDLVADVRAATPSEAAELAVPDARARAEVLRRCGTHLARAIRTRLLERRATAAGLRARLTDPRFLIAERQQQIDDLLARVERRATRTIQRRRASTEEVGRRLLERHPRVVLARAQARLQPLSQRLQAGMRLRLRVEHGRLTERSARLRGLSPLSVLGRGYAIASRTDGRAIRDAAEVSEGESFGVRLDRGRLDALVTRVRPSEADGWDDTVDRGEGE
jgi:exodeoxyribonuclease VII large subunit